MTDWATTDLLRSLAETVLILGLIYGAYADLRRREVSDTLWVALGIVGALLGLLDALSHGLSDALLWLVVSGFVLEHMVPWDAALARRSENLPGLIEIALYLGVGALLAIEGLLNGIGPNGLPLTVLAVYAGVLFARALFEVGVLYGGADAKALMVAGLLVPLDAIPLLALPPSATTILSIYPFTVSLLMDAAIFSAGVPIYLALLNAVRGEFEFPRAFTGFRIPVDELADRYVWLKDPTFNRDAEEEAVETTADDVALRRRQQAELRARGITRVWVTPQLPFIVFLAAGAIAAVVAGNLIFDLVALL